MQDIDRAVGLRITTTRRKKGITQDQLAEMAGLNRTHLYRLETGKQRMTLRTLKLNTWDVRVRELVNRL